MSRKDELFKSILDESIPDDFISLVGINTADCVKECELLDYKAHYSTTKSALAKTAKQVVSFYNTFGGYLVYGVSETIRDTRYETCGHDFEVDLVPLRGAIDRYTGTNIGLSTRKFEVPVQDTTHSITVLAIPRRDDKNPIHFISHANDEKNKLIFKKNETVIRIGDQSRTAMNGDDFEILFASRNYPPQSLLRPGVTESIIQHNLPDKNLICPTFIGRKELIAQLWSWLADDFEYIKVLAGEGGRGKTSIAYEFSIQVIKNATSRFEMVLWMTAKERQFDASRNAYVDLPEVHFHSTETLLRRVVEELGVMGDVEGESIPALKRAAIDALGIIPTLMIVDNLDSMDIEEQRRVVEAVRQIADRSQARVLVTTRSNVSMPIEQCVEVPGLETPEYQEFVRNTCESYKVRNLNSSFLTQMYEISDGSPLFTQSILRLIRLGQHPPKALKDWQGVEGLAVRSAALQREIEQLTPESRRVLYALALVRSGAYEELKQIVNYDDQTLRRTVDQLSSLFLIHAPSIIESERRFEIPESTARLIVDLKDKLVTRPEEINARVTGIYKKTSKERLEVGRAIRQSMALMTNGDFDKATQTVQVLVRKPKFSHNADLLLMKGRVLLVSGDRDRARIEFKKAYDSGGRKNLLFDLWVKAEREGSHFQGMYDVCDLSLKRGAHVDDSWVYRRAEANVGLASQLRDLDLKLIHLRKAADDLAALIRASDRSRRNKLVTDSTEVHDLIWYLCSEAKNWSRGYLEILDCIRRGDVRGVVFHRAIDSIDYQLVHARRIGESAEIESLEVKLDTLKEQVINRNLEMGISEETKAEKRISDLLRAL